MPTGAQSYPERPVRIILGAPPGSGPDIVGRILAEKMAGELGQPVIVENRPGASGTIAAQLAAKANADGYSVLLGTAANLAVVPHLLPSANYDPITTFVPVGLIQRGPYVMAVYPGVPARNLPEFIAYAKSNPGKLDFGTPGTGSAHHVVWELFQLRTETRLTHIPYKGGAQAVQDTIAGRIAVFMASANSRIAQFVAAGKLRYIAVTGATRLKQLPSVPTVSEQGVPGFEAYAWWGLLIPPARRRKRSREQTPRSTQRSTTRESAGGCVIKACRTNASQPRRRSSVPGSPRNTRAGAKSSRTPESESNDGPAELPVRSHRPWEGESSWRLRQPGSATPNIDARGVRSAEG